LIAADALLVSHRSLRERLSPEQLDAAETDAAALAKERVAFEKRTGQLLNYASLASDAGISPNTAKPGSPFSKAPILSTSCSPSIGISTNA